MFFVVVEAFVEDVLSGQSVVTETFWKPLQTTLGLLLCEKVAISTLVPGELAMMDTFFSILSPGCRTASLAERSRERRES